VTCVESFLPPSQSPLSAANAGPPRPPQPVAVPPRPPSPAAGGHKYGAGGVDGDLPAGPEGRVSPASGDPDGHRLPVGGALADEAARAQDAADDAHRDPRRHRPALRADALLFPP